MTEDLRTYKEQHEAFVSNLQGSSVFEVLACVSQVPAFIMLLKLVQRNSKPSIIRDFLLFTLPTLLSITLFANLNYWSLLVLVVGLGYYHSRDRNRITQPSTPPTTPLNPSNLGETDDTSYLTLFKGANVALTCLAILAIDFRVFPRSFGKTETFGISLMDFGVGSFIFSSAVTSKHARGLPSTPLTPPTPPPIHSTPLNSHQTSHHSPPNQLTQSLSMSRILTACSDIMPMRRFLVLGLGFGRLVILKAINYQEHVSEYGVHWNFFMTLFSVWLGADVIHALVPRRWIVWIAFVWLSLYQAALCFTSLTSFMFSEERGGDLLSANKEGVISLNGYIPLYLLSETAAHVFFHSHVTPPPSPPPPVNNTDSHTTSDNILPIPTSSSTTSLNLRKPQQHPLVDAEEPVTSSPLSLSKESDVSGEVAPLCPALPQHNLNYALLRQLSLSTSLLWLYWLWLSTTMQPTSRRLCNASYVILVLAMCLTMVSLCHIADVFGGKNVPILTLQYMNHHSVIVFLAANLLTGLVNNVMRTIYASDWLAFLVLAVHGLLATTSAWLAEYFLYRPRVK